jgi:hypothetical protein
VGNQPVLCGIDADSIQPCVERTVVAKARQGAIGANETVLDDILDLGRIAHHARNQPGELALVLGNEQTEGLLVTRLHPLDQQPVCLAISHELYFLFPPAMPRGLQSPPASITSRSARLPIAGACRHRPGCAQ